MFGKRTDKAQGNILTDNAVTRGAGQLNKKVGEVGKEVEHLSHETEKLLRPVNRVMAFASGIAIGGLRGMSQWARRGAMLGLAVGAVAMVMGTGGITLPAILPFVGGLSVTGGWTAGGMFLLGGSWAAGLIGGALAGGIVGGIKGGPERLAYEERKAKYADELALQNANKPRETGRRAPAINKNAYKDYRESHSDGNFDRFQQRFDLAAEDTSASWADRVSGGSSAEMGR